MKHPLLTMLAFAFISFANAQDYKFGKVSKEEVANNVYEKDTSANAVILYKYRNTYFETDSSEEWIIVTDVHERIKILNKSGLDYATKKISLFKEGNSAEKIMLIKGLTFNKIDKKVESEKLKKNAIFENEKSENIDEIIFTMPNAKVGSVVEWTYKIKSPFLKIDDLIIQENIPIEHYFAKIGTISFFKYKRIAKGGFKVNIKEYDESKTLPVVFGKGSKQSTFSNINVIENVSEYELKSIPAIKKEPYLDNIDNYRFLITYELESVKLDYESEKKYSTSWEEVVKLVNESDNFGKQLVNTKFLREEAEQIKAKGTSSIELTKNAFSFIRDRMSWNGKYGKYTRKGIEKAFLERTGDVSEINLMLVALLRECGVKANPVLVSTRDHGIPNFPTTEGFNYVVVCVYTNDKYILLDATDKLSYLDVLPKRVLNWEGTLVLEDGRSKKINMYPEKVSQNNTIMSITINDDGSLSGRQNSSYSDLDGMAYRKNFQTYSKDEYIDRLINTYLFDDLTEFEVKNDKELDKSVIESYSFEIDEGVDMVGNEIYFSPLFFHRLTENPFKLNERNFPVNFVYASSEKKMINVKIPEGYQVTSTPEPIKISLPDEMGSFLFNISVVEGGLNVISTFEINTAIIPEFKYAELKEFYNQRVLKETEKVVLTKM